MNALRSLAIRFAEGLLGLAGGRQRLLVMIYHRVHPRADPMYPYDPDAETFRFQVQALAEDFRVLPLGEALRLQQCSRLPARAVAITFDDGFADNATVALPILREFGLTATFFVASGYLRGGFMFNDAVIEACRQAPAGRWSTGLPQFGSVDLTTAESRFRVALRMLESLKYEEPQARAGQALRLLRSAGASMPAQLMMSPDQVRELRGAGMDIGGHTRSHPILARVGDEEAEREIAGGRADLLELAAGPVELFAYPNGRPGRDFGARDVDLVRRAGFRAAVTTEWGFVAPGSDPFRLPRVASWGRDPWRFSGRLTMARARGAVAGSG